MTDENPHNPYQAPDSTIQSQAKPDTPELASRLYRLLGALIDGLVQLLVIVVAGRPFWISNPRGLAVRFVRLPAP